MAAGMVVGAGVALFVGPRSRQVSAAIEAFGNRLSEAADEARSVAAAERAALARRHLAEHSE